MKTWSYKTVWLSEEARFASPASRASLDAILNGYGDEGWELVTIFDLTPATGNRFFAVMKRPNQ